MDLRPVTLEDAQHLRTFRCATEGLAFTLEVEQQIRTSVPEELAEGRVEALGSWDGDQLAALIVFKPHSRLWMVTVLGTDHRYRERKQAFRLKREIVRRARDAGAAAVTSHVHRDNAPMAGLNRKLDGVPDPGADPEGEYVLWTVPCERV